MKSNLRTRIDRLNETVNMGQLLNEYGYDVLPVEREQQFRCDLHGQDNSPSARYYPQSNSTYCFTCVKARDCIQFIREKESLSFMGAIRFLERRFDLPFLEFDEVPSEVKIVEKHEISFEDEERRLQTYLQNLTSERELDPKRLLTLWEAFDFISHQVYEKEYSEASGIELLRKLRKRASTMN